MKNYILISLLFLTNLAIAQQFKTSVILSPGFSRYNSANQDADFTIKNNNINFCYSGAIREEFYFPKIISIGIEANYLYNYGYLISPADNQIAGDMSIYKHSLSIYSLYFPLLVKIRTKPEINKGMYFYIGSGVSYLIHESTKIDLETWDMSGNLVNNSPVTTGYVLMTNKNYYDIGIIGFLGLGKSFKIKKKTFFCEARYNLDLNDWLYPTVNGPDNNPFELKRQCLLLNLGFTI